MFCLVCVVLIFALPPFSFSPFSLLAFCFLVFLSVPYPLPLTLHVSPLPPPLSLSFPFPPSSSSLLTGPNLGAREEGAESKIGVFWVLTVQQDGVKVSWISFSTENTVEPPP